MEVPQHTAIARQHFDVVFEPRPWLLHSCSFSKRPITQQSRPTQEGKPMLWGRLAQQLSINPSPKIELSFHAHARHPQACMDAQQLSMRCARQHCRLFIPNASAARSGSKECYLRATSLADQAHWAMPAEGEPQLHRRAPDQPRCPSHRNPTLSHCQL